MASQGQKEKPDSRKGQLPEGCLGEGNKYWNVGFLSETPKLLKPSRVDKVMQGHHWLQIMSAASVML